ncbi:hypothetical protein GCM10007063_20880 [Lentibacillus kapialis]|uniref:DUF1468 domain-containing protein n=1 Tax=Lentibacillus kapialis TaxID=340214 RepID=A0A917PXY1_9BACI|nr:tripartite tricarboxylate transporter TctB family protein [Lentibacillus kapialis]GGJ98382.1 hypothetical protein GCM10007063_20880 [Lentibacillus kapialis]
MNEMKRERYTALSLLIFGTTLYLSIPYVIQGSEGLGEVGPDFFPRILAILIIVLSAIQFVKSFFPKIFNIEEIEADDEFEYVENDSKKGRFLASAFVFLMMLLYIFVLVEFLSFILSTIITMSVIMWVLSVRKWYFYLILISFVIIVDYIFRNLLYVQLP